MNISALSPAQLRQAADLQEKIQALQAELDALLGAEAPAPVSLAVAAPVAPARGRKKRRQLSPEGIANIRAGVAKRMAKKGGAKAPAPSTPAAGAGPTPKRKVSAAGRKALSLAAKARWAKARAQGKSRL